MMFTTKTHRLRIEPLDTDTPEPPRFFPELPKRRTRKHRLLALGCVLAMLLALCGCGATTAGVPPQEEAAMPEEQLSDGDSTTQEDEHQEVHDEQATNGLENSQATDSLQEEMQDDSAASNNTGVTEEITGLIIMQARTKPVHNDTSVISDSVSLFSFDPATGSTRQIATFSIKPLPEGRTFTWFPSAARMRHWFDAEYTKLCADCNVDSMEDRHAGWIARDGSFFDVTEAVGLGRQSDFDSRVDHESAGITSDGLFVFYEWSKYPHRESSQKVYCVPIDDVRPETLQEVPYDDIIAEFREILPDGRAVCAMDDNCVIADDIKGTNREYLAPGDSRINWCPVLSPDSTQVAFLSRPKIGDEAADIYIVPVGGDSPVRVAEHNSFTMASQPMTVSAYLRGGDSVLIDWR